MHVSTAICICESSMSLSSVLDISNLFPNCTSTLTSFIGVSRLNGTTAVLTTLRCDLSLLMILPFPNCWYQNVLLFQPRYQLQALDGQLSYLSSALDLPIWYGIPLQFSFYRDILLLSPSIGAVSYFSLHGRKNIQIHRSSEHQLIWAFRCGWMRRGSVGF